MTLGELHAWVLRTVKRPELSQQAMDAINSAEEFVTAHGDFNWDLVEGSFAISSAVLAQSFVIATNFTRFRKVKYLKPQGFKKPLDWVDPSKTFERRGDATQVMKNNCWYRAGANIVFSCSVAQSTMLYGYYQYPRRYTLAADAAIEDYLMSQCPTVLHDLAVSRVFDENGNEAEAARIERRALRLLSIHKADKQDSVSHA